MLQKKSEEYGFQAFPDSAPSNMLINLIRGKTKFKEYRMCPTKTDILTN